jgi:hypothetical protein
MNVSWLKKEIIPNSDYPMQFSYNLQDSKMKKNAIGSSLIVC